MVGSSDSIASANITLNTIVAEAFCEAADILEKSEDFDMECHDLIKKYMTEHHRVIFNGDGYSDEWVAEAERRGLPNIKSMVEAVEAAAKYKEKAEFLDKYVVFVMNDNSRRYHTYDCENFTHSNFWTYSPKLAEAQGFKPCAKCIE